MGDSSRGLMKLRTVRFRYKKDIDPSGLEQYGLVAEEVAKVYPDLVVYDEKGQPQTVRYHFVNAMLLNEVQKQARQIAQLTEQTRQVAEQAREMAQLSKETIDALTARVAQLETVVASQGHVSGHVQLAVAPAPE
jgi:ABC-type hemin transport system substrate-binding protein